MSTSAAPGRRPRRPPRFELEAVAGDFRRRLAELEDGAVADMVRGLLETDRRIAAELARVTRRVDLARAAGAEPGISFTYGQGRLTSLRREVDAELRAFGARVVAGADALAVASADEAVTFSRAFVRAAARDLGLAGADSFGVSPLLDRERVLQTRANLSAGSPLRELVDTFGEQGSADVIRGLTEAAALGESPVRTARRIRSSVVESYRGRARLIARTEAQRTVREVTRQSYERNPVVGAWRWLSSLDRRTCPACFAMHGSLHPTEEVLSGHPGCRCVMVPVLRAELRGVGTEPTIEAGEDLFARLDTDAQLAILGPGKLEAYHEGRLSLSSLAERRESDRWGPMIRSSSLERAEGRGPGARLPTLGERPGPRGGAPPAPPTPAAVAASSGGMTVETARGFTEPLARRADSLEEVAAQVEARFRPELRAGARLMRDSWSPEAGRGYGAVVRGRSAGFVKGENAYGFNAGNANSWHYINGRRRTLGQYEDLLIDYSRGERLPDFTPPAGLEPLARELLDLDDLARDIKARAGADRRIVDVLTAPEDDWRYDPADLRVAAGEVERAIIDGQRLLKAAQEAAKQS